jgi:hypothetical protein
MGSDAAQSSGLIQQNADNIVLGVDHTNVTPNGRPSLRFSSVKTYSSGLIIADLAHMPSSACGSWPAFWTLGSDWPNKLVDHATILRGSGLTATSGEIDIIEGVNSDTTNSMTLHTNPGCTIVSNAGFSGAVKTNNCDAKAQGNAGCGVAAGNDSITSYGDGFNSAGGGVYATEWTDTAISIWHFARGVIPADITAGTPNPDSWGAPDALFQLSCNIGSNFKDHQIVFDTTFCGQWAGNQDVWSQDAVCGQKAATCNDYVANNPAAFVDSYWQINSVKVFQQSDSGLIGNMPGSPSVGSPSAVPPSAVPSAMSSSLLPTGVPFSATSASGRPRLPKSTPTMEALVSTFPSLAEL